MKTITAIALLLAISAHAEEPKIKGQMYYYCHEGIRYTTDSIYKQGKPVKYATGEPERCRDDAIHKVYWDEAGVEHVRRIK